MKGDRLQLRYDDDGPVPELERRGTETPKGSCVVADAGSLIVVKIAGSHGYWRHLGTNLLLAVRLAVGLEDVEGPELEASG